MKDINHCTGCGACAEICHHNAISLTQSDEGFFYPVIDFAKCVHCGLCDQVCEKCDDFSTQKPIESYSAFAKSAEQRESGSSGGIFGIMAEKFLAEGGVVFGAVFSSEEKKVVHTSTEKVSIEKMKRSKYVQSDTKHTFSEAKALLQAGIKVLYVGTPCEIAGLYAFLEKEYENLLTMDFMCHGVPSPGFFYDALMNYENMENSKITDYTFREKNLGWRKQSVNIYFENEKVIQKESEDFYYYYFLHNYTLRRSCFGCQYYKNHPADITVADYWTVPKEKDDDKGISLVFLNSEKGSFIFSEIQNALVTEPYTELNIERFSHRSYKTKPREAFFKYYTKNGFERTLRRYVTKMRLQRLKKRTADAVMSVGISIKKRIFK